jgi:hypothetical protein
VRFIDPNAARPHQPGKTHQASLIADQPVRPDLAWQTEAAVLAELI